MDLLATEQRQRPLRRCCYIIRQVTVAMFILLCIRLSVASFPTKSSASFHSPWRRVLSAYQSSRRASITGMNNALRLSNTSRNDGDPDSANDLPHVIFPGGGIFFYWQAGAITYLRDEQGYDFTASTMTGASAGALAATLAATNVDFYQATALALKMAQDAGVWDRSGGLQGIWGPLIYDWLDELLPENAVELAESRSLSLLLTPVPNFFGKEKIDKFQSRRDLIECNMASVHLPWFLDGELTSSFRNRRYIDGSFLAKSEDYHPTPTVLQQPQQKSSPSTLILGHNMDPRYKTMSMFSFVEAASPDGIYKMLEDGKLYAKSLEEQGKLDFLPKREKRQ
jgi:Patatin-like phospholipase